MIKSKEVSDPSSCLNKSQEDEMVFVLCARDPLAARLVRQWADRYELFRGGRPQKAAEARAAADAMDAWRKEHA